MCVCRSVPFFWWGDDDDLAAAAAGCIQGLDLKCKAGRSLSTPTPVVNSWIGRIPKGRKEELQSGSFNFSFFKQLLLPATCVCVCVESHPDFFSFLTHFHSLRPFFFSHYLFVVITRLLFQRSLSLHIYTGQKREKNVKNSGIQFLDNSVWR